VELYSHSPVCYNGIGLHQLITETVLPNANIVNAAEQVEHMLEHTEFSHVIFVLWHSQCS
jgi:hypothetical protein